MPGVDDATLSLYYDLVSYVLYYRHVAKLPVDAMLGGGKTLMISEFISVQILDLVRWGVGAMLATTLVATIFLALALLARVVDLGKLFGAK